jgi:hypothetical protein
VPGPDWSRPLPRPPTIPDVLTLETLADIWAPSSCSTIRSAMDTSVTPCCHSAARAMRASTHSLKADSIEASWGRIDALMGRPAKFRFFKCPSCAALYQVVKAEARPETEASELACLTCVAPLNPRDGKFVLIYFLLREGHRKCG